MRFIDLQTQYLEHKEAIDRRIHQVLDHGQYVMGPEVNDLEAALAEYIGVKHCVTSSSGTDSLIMALMALNLKPGDEVITTPFSFFASAEVIVLVGAVPVFVDIDPLTYNIDPSKIESAITEKTKAIMPVSLYGQCADMDAINAIANRHKIPVIEDAAQSFGASYKGKKSGALSTVSCTSFFPSKPLGCYGDGGACFTNDDYVAEQMRQIRVHGQDRRYHHVRLGLTARMDSIQAAVLLEKLIHFDNEINLRNQVADFYRESFPKNISAPFVSSDCVSVWAQYTIMVEDRDSLQESLQEKGIPTAVHYPVPLFEQPALEGQVRVVGDMMSVKNAAEKVISLPMHPYLTKEQITLICNELANISAELLT